MTSGEEGGRIERMFNRKYEQHETVPHITREDLKDLPDNPMAAFEQQGIGSFHIKALSKVSFCSLPPIKDPVDV